MICQACRRQASSLVAAAGRRAAVNVNITASRLAATRGRGVSTRAAATAELLASFRASHMPPVNPRLRWFSSSPSSLQAAPPKPEDLDAAESQIWDLLSEAFAPAELSVQDISGGCGSMYGIEISSDKFRGATMLKQQRMVNAVLGELMKGWHGVQLKTRVP